MQGVSGSGKSTKAEEIMNDYNHAVLVSADLYFMQEGGYKFDPSKLGEAHQSCLRNFLDLITGAGLDHSESGPDLVIVDNTNTQLWEMAPYIQTAAAYGHEIEVIRCVCPVEKAAGRNLHGVPEEAVQGMASRLEKPLPFWPCTFREVVTG